MSDELHWEWRGFGGLTSVFAYHFCNLPVMKSSEKVTDLYLWKEKLNTNIKLRSGAEDRLKFKRFKTINGSFEQWLEDPAEVFHFPLNDTAWHTLREELQNDSDRLPSALPEPLMPAKTLQYLQNKGYEVCEVSKIRESRILNVSNGEVKVEWCCIAKPQSIISVGLENHAVDNISNDEKKIANLKEAIEILRLHKQPLNVMNYLNALEYWTNDQNI